MQHIQLDMVHCCSYFNRRFLASQMYIDHISTFLVFSMVEDSIDARTELSTLGLAELSSIVLIAHSFVIPVVKTYDCISGVPWGSSVPLAVPGPTFLSSSLGVFDSCLFSSSSFPFLSFHCSHNMSWQKCHSYHPHLNPCHSCTHLHNDLAFHT